VSDTVLRQWSILRIVPRYPRKLTAGDIAQRLDDQGFEVSKRTVERDLEKLSGIWPLVADQRSKPYGWSWERSAPLADIPGMDLSTALAFQLSGEYLEPLLPPATLKHLKPYISQATRVLGEASPGKLGAWSKKVKVIGRGPVLLPPETASGIHENVLQALLDNRRIEARYTPRGSGEERDYVINPLGAVFRHSVAYLVGTAYHYEDILQFALHRFSAVEVTGVKARRPRGFDLNDYIRQGGFGYPSSDQPIKLKALFDAGIAHHLQETPLSADQQLTPRPDGGVELTASVLDTEELRWWLLGFGSGLEVKGPAKLRRRIAEAAREMHDLYSS